MMSGADQRASEAGLATRLRSRLHAPLPPVESAVLFSVAIGWWAYFVRRWFTLSQEMRPFVNPYLEKLDVRLRLPFGLLDLALTRRDRAHHSWNVSAEYVVAMIPWMLTHCIAERVIRLSRPKLISHFHVLEFCLYVAYRCRSSETGFGSADPYTVMSALAFFFVLPVVSFYASYAVGSAFPAWIFTGGTFILERMLYNAPTGFGAPFMKKFDVETRIVFYQTFVWGVMRTVSFCTVVGERSSMAPLSHCLGFYCYLPSSFLGPLSTFDTYLEGVYRPPRPLSFKYCLRLATRSLRFAVVLLGHSLLVHFVFLETVVEVVDPSRLRALDLPTLTAVGIFRILSFSAMYVPTYGFSQMVAEIDGFEVSWEWKHFT